MVEVLMSRELYEASNKEAMRLLAQHAYELTRPMRELEALVSTWDLTTT